MVDIVNLGLVIVGTTAYIKGTVVDEDGTAFNPTNAKTTLYDVKGTTATIVNAHEDQALTVGSPNTGNFSLELLPADNVFVDSARDAELRLVRFKFDWNTGARVAIMWAGFTLGDDDTPTS